MNESKERHQSLLCASSAAVRRRARLNQLARNGAEQEATTQLRGLLPIHRRMVFGESKDRGAKLCALSDLP
jgi:hypothetical protein